MNRTIKLLATLVAALGLTALVAGSAAAETHQPLKLTAGEYPAILTGEQIEDGALKDHVFEGALGEITCKKALFHGTIADKDHNTEITITPTYSECVQLPVTGGSFPATVEMTHCDYLLTEGTEVAGSNGDEFNKGQISLTCPNEGEKPHTKVYNDAAHTSLRCEYTVDTFVHKGEITYTNTTKEGVTKDVDMTWKVSGVVTTRTFGTFLQCGAATTESTYTGTTTVRAYQDKGFTVTNTTPTVYDITEGAQVSLTVSK